MTIFLMMATTIVIGKTLSIERYDGFAVCEIRDKRVSRERREMKMEFKCRGKMVNFYDQLTTREVCAIFENIQ